MARDLRWVDDRFGRGIASLLEDYASDLFSLFGDDDDATEVALDRLDGAARLRPLGPEALLLKARMLASLGRMREAHRLLETLHRENPRNGSIIAELASLAEDEGRSDEADRLYREALRRLQPTEPDAEYTVLGYASMLADQRKVARARPIVKRWIARLARSRRPHRALDAWLSRHGES